MVNPILSISYSGKIYPFSESEQVLVHLAGRPLNSRVLGFSCTWTQLISVRLWAQGLPAYGRL